VSKGAAVMILTDDNFATIVKAVEFGRSLYDNLMKYLRFQMASLVAFIAVFLGATIFNIANGTPLNPLQILWLNFAIDIPLAIALGFDIPTPGLMERKPRPLAAPVFTRNQWIRITAQGLIMTVGVLGIYTVVDDDKGVAIASTMLLTALSLFHIVLTFCVRDEYGTVFNREALPHGRQLRLLGISFLLTILATELGLFQRIFSTVSLTLREWLVCLGVALILLVVEEAVKYYLARRAEQPAPQVLAPAAAQATPQGA
jgi:Ca2+-transporting ATPase